MKPILSHGVTFVKDSVDVLSIKSQLTVKVWESATESYKYVNDYIEDGTTITVPRVFGEKYCNSSGIVMDDRTALGSNIAECRKIKLWDYQKPFVDDIYKDLIANRITLAKAATGKGKSVCSLEVARRLGVTTVIIVDQEFLKNQWISEAKKFLKYGDEGIGLIQGKVRDYEGKSIVIAMAQTLFRMQYDPDIAGYFGLMICDESDTLGAEQFSKVFRKIDAKYRLGVSATPKRTDGFQRIIDNHLGPVSVQLTDKHSKSIARYVEYPGVISWYSNISPKAGRYVTEISEDTSRNWVIVEIIKRLRKTGRSILILSDRIEQLENLIDMCSYRGVPEEDMGLVAGYTIVWGYAKNPTPARKPLFLEKGAEYTPVIMQSIRKKIPKTRNEETKNNKPMIFSTYGMFKKGVDVPRLSAGIDCTPRAKAEQTHGRILRVQEGKPQPIWVTIRDTMSYKAEYQFANRVKEYTKSNAEIYEWHLDKGIKPKNSHQLVHSALQRVSQLKQLKIITNIEGVNTIAT